MKTLNDLLIDSSLRRKIILRCNSILKNNVDSEDICQNTYLKLLEKSHKENLEEIHKPEQYILRIAVNKSLSKLKRDKYKKSKNESYSESNENMDGFFIDPDSYLNLKINLEKFIKNRENDKKQRLYGQMVYLFVINPDQTIDDFKKKLNNKEIETIINRIIHKKKCKDITLMMLYQNDFLNDFFSNILDISPSTIYRYRDIFNMISGNNKSLFAPFISYLNYKGQCLLSVIKNFILNKLNIGYSFLIKSIAIASVVTFGIGYGLNITQITSIEDRNDYLNNIDIPVNLLPHVMHSGPGHSVFKAKLANNNSEIATIGSGGIMIWNATTCNLIKKSSIYDSIEYSKTRYSNLAIEYFPEINEKNNRIGNNNSSTINLINNTCKAGGISWFSQLEKNSLATMRINKNGTIIVEIWDQISGELIYVFPPVNSVDDAHKNLSSKSIKNWMSSRKS